MEYLYYNKKIFFVTLFKFYCFVYIIKAQMYKIKLNVIQPETSAFFIYVISFHKGMKIHAVQLDQQ